MERHVIYCSGCDHEVEVFVRDGAPVADTADLDGAVCAEIGALCTGTTCPICARAPMEPRPVQIGRGTGTAGSAAVVAGTGGDRSPPEE